MSERTYTYTGGLPSGRLHLSTRVVPFVAGEPVEVSAEEAGLLDGLDEWKAGTRPPKGRKAASTPPTKGDEPDETEPTP